MKLMKKKLIRRTEQDRSQTLRHWFQGVFFALNVWIGVQFWLFVRYYETGGRSIEATRPAGVEGWLPIASLMSLKAFALTGQAPQVHPAGMFLLIAFVAICLLLRRTFCSWLCPIGTISEYLWRMGQRTFGRTFAPPRWLDIALRSLKYVLMGLFAAAVVTMSVPEIEAFLGSPYGLVDDVRMLDFFRYLSVTAAVVLFVLVAGSVFVQNLWCRYLCPYGALLGIASLASPLRIRRESGACIDCAKCAHACPAALPVDRLVTIGSAECTGCLECVAACPAEGALFMAAPRRRKVPVRALVAAMAILFLGVVGYAKVSGHWNTPVPERVWWQLIPQAGEIEHP
jgi:polyferredoxin